MICRIKDMQEYPKTALYYSKSKEWNMNGLSESESNTPRYVPRAVEVKAVKNVTQVEVEVVLSETAQNYFK